MSIMRKLWATITRKGSEKGTYPIQQITYLGRVTDAFTLFPYGMHANLPAKQLGLLLDAQGQIFMGTSAVGRIKVEAGEVVFYHPGTQSKVHFKASGDIDVVTNAQLNIVAKTVAVKADSVDVDASVTNLGVGGLAIARVGDAVSVNVVGGSSSGTHTGIITSGGVNTSI